LHPTLKRGVERRRKQGGWPGLSDQFNSTGVPHPCRAFCDRVGILTFLLPSPFSTTLPHKSPLSCDEQPLLRKPQMGLAGCPILISPPFGEIRACPERGRRGGDFDFPTPHLFPQPSSTNFPFL
jgi:hypothetical protein